MRFQRHFRVEIAKSPEGGIDLVSPHVRGAVQELPVKIRNIDAIEIDHADAAHTCAGEVEGGKTSQPAGPDHEDGRALQLLLPFPADLGKGELPAVPD